MEKGYLLMGLMISQALGDPFLLPYKQSTALQEQVNLHRRSYLKVAQAIVMMLLWREILQVTGGHFCDAAAQIILALTS